MEMISNSLCDRLFSEFTNEDEQVFLQHFRMYLDYNDDNDYVIDLDKVLKFLGFANKGNAKKVLLKHFIQDKHYLLLPVEKQDSAQHGGNNKIQILMTPATFKDLCLRAETSRASQIRSYYLKMERIVMKHLEDTLTTTYQQLYTAQQKVKALENEMANSKKKQTKNTRLETQFILQKIAPLPTCTRLDVRIMPIYANRATSLTETIPRLYIKEKDIGRCHAPLLFPVQLQ